MDNEKLSAVLSYMSEQKCEIDDLKKDLEQKVAEYEEMRKSIKMILISRDLQDTAKMIT